MSNRIIDWAKNNKIYILFFFFVLTKGLLWTWVIPPFLAPDELPHFSYTQYLAEEKEIPKNSPGKISPLHPTLSEEAEKSSEFLQHNKTVLSLGHMDFPENIQRTPEGFQTYSRNVSKENYKNSAAIYSPFYYILEVIPYVLGYNLDIFSRLYLMRAFSLFFLFIALIFSYKIALFISKENTFALIVVAIIALMPSINASSFGGINNDAALIAFSHILLYYLVKILDNLDIRIWSIIKNGILLGLALLTKPVAIIFIPLTAGVFMYKGFKKNEIKKTALALLGVFTIAAIMSIVFYIRLIDSIINGSSNEISQTKNIFAIENIFLAVGFDIIRKFFLATSIWLQLQFFDRFYPFYIKSFIFALELFGLIGLIYLAKNYFNKDKDAPQSGQSPYAPLVLCIAAFLLISGFYTFLYYKQALMSHYYDFAWFGRYYLPVIAPIVIIMLFGLKKIFHLIKISEKVLYIGLLIFFLFLHNYAFFNIALQYNYL